MGKTGGDRVSENYKKEQLLIDKIILKHQQKICSKCGVMTPLHLFTKAKNRRLGLGSLCLNCKKISNVKTLNTERGYFGELFHSMKKSVKRKKAPMLEFVDKDDLLNHWREQEKIFGNYCPGLGIEMTFIKGHNEGKEKKKLLDTNCSIDRILPWEGYTKTNTIFTSWKYNNMKGNMTPKAAYSYLQMVKLRYNTHIVNTEE